VKETKGLVTFRGNPVTLVGNQVKVGQKAPDFKLITPDMKEVTLADSKGKVRLLSVVVSLDTSVCDIQTQQFEGEAGKFPEVMIYTISVDLPFAQARYCGAHSIKNLQTLSDHRDASFGTAYGVLIKEMRLLARSIFIIDKNDVIRYIELVKDSSHAPDYDKAISALKEVLGK